MLDVHVVHVQANVQVEADVGRIYHTCRGKCTGRGKC